MDVAYISTFDVSTHRHFATRRPQKTGERGSCQNFIHVSVYPIYKSGKFHFLFMKDMESGFWCGEVWELLDLPFDPLNFGRNSLGIRIPPVAKKRSQVVDLAFWGSLWIVARWVSKRRIFITTWKCVLRSCSPLSTSCSFFCEDTFFLIHGFCGFEQNDLSFFVCLCPSYHICWSSNEACLQLCGIRSRCWVDGSLFSL